MRSPVAVASVLVVLVGLSISGVSAQDFEARRPRSQHPRANRLQQATAEMDLTLEQRQKIDALIEEYGQELRGYRETHRSVRTLFQEAKELQEAGDYEGAKQKREEILKITEPIRELDQRYLEKVKELLSPEQAEVLSEELARRGGQRRGEGRRDPRWRRERRRNILEELDLTEEQKEKIRKLREKQQKSNPDFESNREKLRKLHEELSAAYEEETVDPEKVKEIKDEIAKIRKELLAGHESFMKKVREILTDEQKETLRKLMQDFKERSPFGREMIFERLNLTEEQKEKISKIQDSLEKKIRKRRGKIQKKQGEISKVFEEIRKYREEFNKEVLAVLTAEQREIYENFLEKMKERMQRRPMRERPFPPEPGSEAPPPF